MATGATHARVATALLVPLGATGAAVMTADPQVGLGLIAGALAGFIVTPDIDIVGMTYEERRIYNVNRGLGTLWRLLWLPYGAFMSHRGISHWPVVGTLTRVLYAMSIAQMALWLTTGIAVAAGYALDGPAVLWPIVVNFHRFMVAMIVTWATQDIGHILLDRWRTAPMLALLIVMMWFCAFLYLSV